MDFDGLEPVDPSAVAGQLPLNRAGELYDCVLSGGLPCAAVVGGRSRQVTIGFSLGLRSPGPEHTQRMLLDFDGGRADRPGADGLPTAFCPDARAAGPSP
jgi:hypothetical protein